jgi:hypothetical protein
LSPRASALLLLAAGPLAAALDCAACHRDIAARFSRTAHANASRVAGAGSILGSFEEGANRMFTRAPGVYFLMERRPDGFYQTGFASGRSHTERFDLVIGSGRRGQSYLYWKDRSLLQLPVSYHRASNRWINSPGYEDGTVHFGRLIPPQCLDCHATRYSVERTSTGFSFNQRPALGIQCAKCHGSSDRHEKLIRPKGLEPCVSCHAGLEDEKPPEPDVHGNQVGLLKSSRCFQQSGTMTCLTCHDVHDVQRDPEVLSARCATCHSAGACRNPTTTSTGCVGCHMPLEQSRLIAVQTYRTHRIAVYRKK